MLAGRSSGPVIVMFDDTQQREVVFAKPGDAAVLLPAPAEEPAERGRAEAPGSGGSSSRDTRSSGSSSSKDAGDSSDDSSGGSGGSPQHAAARAAPGHAGREQGGHGQLMLGTLARARSSSRSEVMRFLFSAVKRLLPQAK